VVHERPLDEPCAAQFPPKRLRDEPESGPQLDLVSRKRSGLPVVIANTSACKHVPVIRQPGRAPRDVSVEEGMWLGPEAESSGDDVLPPKRPVDVCRPELGAARTEQAVKSLVAPRRGIVAACIVELRAGPRRPGNTDRVASR